MLLLFLLLYCKKKKKRKKSRIYCLGYYIIENRYHGHSSINFFIALYSLFIHVSHSIGEYIFHSTECQRRGQRNSTCTAGV